MTIAFKSASLACACLQRESNGETVDWQADYADVLRGGIDTFRAYVEAWDDGRFQTDFSPGREAPLGAVHTALPSTDAWPLGFLGRNNAMLAEALRQMRPSRG